MGFHQMNPAGLVKFNSAVSSKFLNIVESEIDSSIKSHYQSKSCHRTFSPSAFRCARRQWFRLRGVEVNVPEKSDTVLDWKAKIGTACHSILQEHIKNAFGDSWIDVENYLKQLNSAYEFNCTHSGYETQVEIFKPYPVRFAVDGLILIDGQYYLLEIKSCEPDILKDLTDIRSEHVDQAICYGAILNVDHVVFLYVDRTYGDLKCYTREILDYEKSDVLSKMDDILYRAEYNLAPDKLPAGDKWCSSNMCPYYQVCKQW